MMNSLKFGVLLAAFGLFAGSAVAEELTETRAIDARVVRVKLGGAIALKLRRGDVASLTITADKDMLPKITAVQTGDTLRLGSEEHGLFIRRSSTMRVELVLPALREMVSEGFGPAEVTGFSGNELDLRLDGAGTVKVTGAYKNLRANLGGLGSMNVWVSDNDSVELDLHGAGHINLGGRGKSLRANLGGLGGLNAQQFDAESVKVELSGLGNASVTARQDANLNLGGLGSITVYGNPQNRTVSADGLGKVRWK